MQHSPAVCRYLSEQREAEIIRDGDPVSRRTTGRDLTDRLSEIDVPVLIVHGEEDPSRAGPMLEELPDAEMELVSEAGHTSNLERPEPVNDAIRSFLDERF